MAVAGGHVKVKETMGMAASEQNEKQKQLPKLPVKKLRTDQV